MPRNASGMVNNSSNARVIARTPAPPVSTSVPSMSKRMILITRRKPIVVGNPAAEAQWRRLAFAADVPGARTLGRGLLVEVDALAFLQLVEGALHRAAVKEPLLTAVVPDEPETPVTHESFDRTARHPSLLGRTHPC